MRWKMMKEDLGVSNAQAWGCPCAPPLNIQGDSASKLGDAPVHPLLHKKSSLRPSPHYIFISSHDSVVIGASLLLVFFCFLVITMLDPSMLDWERYTLHFIIEHSRASLISVEC